jgi:hypothetical protein
MNRKARPHIGPFLNSACAPPPRRAFLQTSARHHPTPSFRTEQADFFFPLRSREAVGLCREKSLFLFPRPAQRGPMHHQRESGSMNLSSLPIPPALSRLIARNSSAAKCRISPRTLFAVVASNFHVRVCRRSPILRPPLDGQGPDLLGGPILRPSVYPGCSKRGPGERSR